MEKISGFFEDGNAAASMNDAPEEAQKFGSALEYAGKYRMKVVSKKFKTKAGDIFEFPNVKVSETKGSLLLNFILETVEATTEQPAGSSAYGMVVLAPKPGSTKKKVDDTMRFAKPRLAALLGKEAMKSFDYGEEWIIDNLTSEFKKTKGKDEWEMTDDHAMQNDVMVTFEVDEYQGKIKLAISDIAPVKDGDESYSIGKSINEEEDAFADDDAEVETSSEVGEPPVNSGSQADIDEF